MTLAEDRVFPDIYDPDLYVDGPIHEIFADLRRHRPGALAGHPRPTRLLGRDAPRRPAPRRPPARLFSAEEGGVVLEDLDPGPAGAEPQHAADDGPAAPHHVPQAARPRASRPRSSPRWSRGSASCAA